MARVLDYFPDEQPLGAICALIFVAFFAIYYRRPGRKLDHIPAVGYQSHLLSYISAFQFLSNAQKMVQQGYDQHRNGIFKVPYLDRWRVVVTGKDAIEMVRKMPEDILSFREAVDESLQVPFTLGPSIRDNHYHHPIVRNNLTRNLPVLLPAIREEIIAAFSDVLRLKDNGRDPDYMGINIKFTVTVVTAAARLNRLPSLLRPLANRFLTSVPEDIDRCIKHLEPIIEERRKNMEEYGNDYPGKPNDMLSWLMDEAEGDETSLRNLTLRILTVNFSAIHTSTMAFCHALFHLAEHPEYIKPMREEIEEVIEREGWTHNAMNQMFKVDSFIKESQRLNPLGCLMINRVARQPFTFPDGTHIPKGTCLSIAAHALHTDDAVYEDPHTFDPFRFADRTKQEYSGHRGDMVSTSTEFIAFGHGRRACPGRFFAANELKLMLAHLVMTYDVKLEGNAERPPNKWLIANCMPNPTAEILIRKRVHQPSCNDPLL
ncbi:hypothetical protein H0H81_009077 [Sphagnurus paluster]|uniref:Cytochrome P450 n=1 Tax=Sphagnurus paluster TaxID=117069 RepID=A0A9P7GIM3_9AGAR|nr:hypothetical protein H0H81_009077 [Sphagnurus paluster]